MQDLYVIFSALSCDAPILPISIYQNPNHKKFVFLFILVHKKQNSLKNKIKIKVFEIPWLNLQRKPWP